MEESSREANSPPREKDPKKGTPAGSHLLGTAGVNTKGRSTQRARKTNFSGSTHLLGT